jgi:hypothetical protein
MDRKTPFWSGIGHCGEGGWIYGNQVSVLLESVGAIALNSNHLVDPLWFREDVLNFVLEHREYCF